MTVSTVAFSPQDKEQLRAHGIPLEVAEQQLERCRKPPNYARLLRACSVGDGIERLDQSAQRRSIDAFDSARGELNVCKFVPASGAASRMFSALLRLLRGQSAPSLASLERAGETDAEAAGVAAFFSRIDDFAFRDELAERMARDGFALAPAAAGDDLRLVLSYLLTPRGLAYGELPKGLLAFHRYPEEVRTAFEEHLVEAATVGGAGDRVTRLHFTVSPNHLALFEAKLAAVRATYEKRFRTRFEVAFSCQEPSTDSLAAAPDGGPFRDANGRLLLRPSGHGALLPNLGRSDGDIVFVKNIDNIVPDHLREPSVRWKKILGGVLVELRCEIFALLDALDECRDGAAERALDYARQRLGLSPPSRPATSDERLRVARETLARPIRVCGMVANTGEPGGGPFWVRMADGCARRQIVEISQIDSRDGEQRAILQSSTHFNPVDLVCSMRDHRGQPYPLDRYLDEEAYLVVEKDHDGRRLRAIERPGLWNGSMAEWITVFVEVPIETFHPVKLVNDLLRPAHQPPER